MPTYNRLTDRALATGITLNDLIHIVITGDTSQNAAGSSYKAKISQLVGLISGSTGSAGTSGTSGANGSSGSSGSSGLNGSSGINGSSGSSGVSGTSGTSGSGSGSGAFLPLSGGTVTGNTYFGTTSGVTIDQVNNRIGINTATPQHMIDAYGTKSRVTYENSSGGNFQISGDTFLPRFQAAGAPSITKPLFSVAMGVRTYDDVTFPGYGKVGDGFLYASNEANGLNIVNRQGTGTTEDYIRFYAGNDANGTIPDIHIQGSGATKGFVGINTIDPQTELHVSGMTTLDGRVYIKQITSGGSSTYLTIDSDTGQLYTATGSTGSSGTSGSSGINGTSGSSGINGTSGTNGTSPTLYQGSFYDTGDQTGIAGNVLTMSANTSDTWNNGIILSANTRFVVANPGVYNLAFSAQMVKTGGNSVTHAHIWLYQNGLDVPNSASQIGFPSNSVYVVPAWNFFFETTTANEYVELKWEINSNVDNQLFIKHQAASGNVPAIPSLIVTINKVG